MKICWDNLEKIRINKSGEFTTLYYSKLEYKERCSFCGQPYLMDKRFSTDFCSHSCYASGKNNPMYDKIGKNNPRTGLKMSVESRKKMSEAAKNREPISEETKLKLSAASKGRKHSVEAVKKMRQSKLGKKRLPEHIESMRKSAARGKDSPLWKGGIRQNMISLYDTYASQLDFAEEVGYNINEQGLKILLVRCAYCNKWFNPTTNAVQHRVTSLNSKSSGEKRLYCSKRCKENCPTFGQQKYPKGFKKATSREVDPYVRKLCFERDEWKCQKCFSGESLHCHHVQGYAQNKIMANDVDNCITLCKDCHKEIHKQDGCNYNDLKCNKAQED